jgi:pilus assembly protein CpaD
VQPRADGEVYAARRATVLDKYKQGQSTETSYPNTNRGRISTVGN